jgi:predicted HAD superfamily Cof-like phosphohydrolase
MDVQASVRGFHEATLIPVGWKPSALSLDRLKLRLNLFDEFIELLEASGLDAPLVSGLKDALRVNIGCIDGQHQDIVEMADALGDIVVVAFGMAIEMGVDLNRVLAEIMRANMSKLDENGNPLVNVCQDEGCPQHGTPHYCDAVPSQTDPLGKVLKASGYRAPDIKSVLDSQDPL